MHMGQVIGYAYNADIWCAGSCINAELARRYGGLFDEPFKYRTLEEFAEKLGVDYTDESSFDTDDFPKAILYGQDDCDDDYCNYCGEPLVED